MTDQPNPAAPPPADEVTRQRDRYRMAWRSARERAQAYGEGILRAVKDREQWQKWCRKAEVEAARLTADRAAVLDEAADAAESVAVRLHAQHDVGGSTGAYEAMTELRRMATEARAADTQDSEAQCGPAPDECGDEPCANHERQHAHAEGEHAFCGTECTETEGMPRG